MDGKREEDDEEEKKNERMYSSLIYRDYDKNDLEDEKKEGMKEKKERGRRYQ